MDGSTALLTNLADLAGSVGTDSDALNLPLRAVVDALRAAVPSYRGLQLTIVDSGQQVTLTDLSSSEALAAVLTSLRIPLRLFDRRQDSCSRIIFYAGTRGAFVDLAADLGYVLTTSTTTPDPDDNQVASALDGRPEQARARTAQFLVLDTDLPPSTKISGLTGLSELSAVNRALGVMIGRGHTPDGAYETLRDAAAASGVETHIYASRLLGSSTDRTDPPI